ncbi:MFS transporter [Thermus tengchongensis]|uniref:MFS transporter n=1 Tax=Thermus tengchongensis TaxID=1214928 RepID=A0A4Y9F9X7_9DEIN|nr:MFS transporter [Thermus tengchongensis]TFU25339.1 MFS transporter [Thermus tengchongensis]
MFRYLPWAKEGLFVFLRLLLAVGLMEGVRTGFFAGLLPFYAPEHLGLAPAVFTLAFTFHQLAENFSKTFGGLMAEKLGFGRTITIAAFTGLVTLLLTPKANVGWLLWGLAILWGLTMSTLYPGLMTLASRIAIPGREARALSYTSVLLLPWTGVGLVGIGQVAQREPEVALTLLITAQVIIFLLAVSLFSFHIPMPKRTRETYPLKRLFLFLPAAFGQTFAPALVSLFILRFAKEELGLEPIAFGGLLLLGGSLAFGLLPFTGRHVDKTGYHVALVGGFFLSALLMARLAFNPSLGELILLAAFGGLGFSFSLSGWNGFLAKNLPHVNRAVILGGLMTVEGLGITLGPAVGGFLWQTFGIKAPFLAGSIIFLSLSLIYAFLFWRKRWK